MKHERRQFLAISIAIALLLFSAPRVSADDPSTGVNGINSQNIGLTGAGVGIGQDEVERPGLPGFDNVANSNPNVVPAAVFLQNGAAAVNANTSNHAEEAAGVMISTNGVHRSVAPAASLFATAFNVPVGPGQPEAAISAQHVATRNGGNVQAINFSFGEPLVGGNTLNGNSLLTQFVDWSAGQHDALYVIAGNENAGGIPVPTDEFNGVTVAYSRVVGAVFRELDPNNVYTEDADGPRRSTDLVAPGTNIMMPALGGGHVANSGTSFAAPHVNAAVALLQEFANTKIAAAAPRFDGDSTRHEVMKAVLMNSADKVQDAGDGLLLGMEKTIINRPASGGTNWLASDAFTDDFIPLDLEMGTGQLNAKRARNQFRPGEHDSTGTAIVPLIAWDYGVTLTAGDVNKYVFERPLRKDSYIAITLAWDRRLTLNDTVTANGAYDIGETFTVDGLTDMDLYLLPKGAASTADSICKSISLVDSVEHIFCKIPADGEYELWVRQFNAPLGMQFYAVAWWAVPVPLHFQCYEIHRPRTSFSVTLDDRFEPLPSTVTVKKPKRICLPADKNGEDPTAAVDPHHLTSYIIKQTAPAFTKITGVSVSNQFGTQLMDLAKPVRMLVPTAKSLVVPPLPHETAINHFKCYRIAGAKFQTPGLHVIDQFGEIAVDIKRPRYLCAPADKNGEGIVDPTQALTCYKVRRASGSPKPTLPAEIFTFNQFGDDRYPVFGVRELCVPSQILGP